MYVQIKMPAPIVKFQFYPIFSKNINHLDLIFMENHVFGADNYLERLGRKEKSCKSFDKLLQSFFKI